MDLITNRVLLLDSVVINRRRVLSRLGAVAAGVLMAGCDEAQSGPPRTDPTPGKVHVTDQGGSGDGWLADLAADWDFDRIVDLQDRGADPTGVRPIDDTIHDAMTDGTLVYLPPGRYRIEEAIVTDAIPSIGIVGEAATIVPPDGYSDTFFAFGWPEVGDDVLFAGIDFDITAPETGGRPVQVMADRRVVVRDVAVHGRADDSSGIVRIDVTDEDGTGLVERLSLPDGADTDEGTTGCQAGDRNRGDLAFVDCHIVGFPDNGLYADPPAGSVAVRGGTYRNNGVAGVRVESSAESIVEGVHVRCDTDRGGENMRGIRLRAGSETTVENCVVDLQRVTSSDGAIVFAPQLAAGTVRNCRIRVDADGVNAIRIKRPNDDTPEDTGPFRFENVVITGSAAGGAAVDASYRDDCVFRNLCVHQTGDDRDGFVFTHVGGELVDSYVSVRGRPFAFTDSSVRRRNVVVDDSPGTTDPSSTEHCN